MLAAQANPSTEDIRGESRSSGAANGKCGADQNPADFPSRDRTTVEQLFRSSLWWQGPPTLAQSNDNWPEWKPRTTKVDTAQCIAAEEKAVASKGTLVMLTTTADDGEEIDLMKRTLTHQSVCRVTA